MNFKARTFISSVICVLSIYIIFVTCIDVIAFDRSFFNAKYKELHTAEQIGMNDKDLYIVSDTLLDYLKDYRDDIDVKVVVEEKMREVYTTREKQHMVDVKNLYQDSLLVRNIFIAIVIALGALLYFDNRKEMKEVLSYAFIRVFVVFGLVLTGLIVFAIADFTTFWTMFHNVFFSNDLWLLDPANSIMINMFPQDFFFALVFRIAACFFAILLLLFWWSKSYRKKLIRALK